MSFNDSSRPGGEAVPMQRNHVIIATALAGGLVIGAASTGYAIAQATSAYGRTYGSQSQSPASSMTPSMMPSMAPSAAMPPAAPAASPDAGNSLSDPSLAQFIAQRAGTRLAGKAPQSVPASQVKALSDQDPAGASIDARTGTITFYAATASFTVVAIAPGTPDMTFTVAGLTNPTIIVPSGTRVTVRFINNDTDEAHGWLVTGNRPPFAFGQPATPTISGAYAGVIGDPTSAGDGASIISFTASGTGSYEYICPMPGHAQMGMHGRFIVR
jgi:rusticyanin